MFAICGLAKVASCVFSFLAWRLYKTKPADINDNTHNTTIVNEDEINMEFENNDESMNIAPNGSVHYDDESVNS